MVNGVATFSNLSINQAATSYQLTAAVTGFTSRTSNFFNVSPGGETQLVYLQQPTSGSFGFTVSPNVKLALEDAYGNVETSDGSTQATLSFAVNPTSAVLTATANPVTASAGVLTFAGLSISKAGTGYQLQALATGLPAAVSNPFNISAAASSTVAASASASTSTSNQTVNLSASVSIPGSSTLVNEGAVTFTILNGSTPIGSAVQANVVNGVASSNSYVLPGGTPAGTYTLQAVYANGADVLGSSDASHTLLVYSLPDLQVASVSGPATGFTGQAVLATWTDENNGAATATGPWVDNVYTATDALGGNPTLVGSFTFDGSLAAGASVQRIQQVVLPQTAGTQWFVVKTNTTGTVPEGTNFGNDTTVAAASISIAPVSLPDLVVTSITPPTNGVYLRQLGPYFVHRQEPGASGDVGLDLAGLGHRVAGSEPGPDLPGTAQRHGPRRRSDPQQPAHRPRLQQPQLPWRGPELSAERQRAAADQRPGRLVRLRRAGRHRRAPPICHGGSQPHGQAGKVSAGFSVTLSPPPDLAVSNVQAPAQDFSGQPMSLSWTVSNTGTGPTAATAWTDAVYMSPTATLGSSATLLGTFAHQGALAERRKLHQQ